jgi:hypothetical protein
MKKVIAILGSLMIVVGLKAQKDPTIKKETTPAVKETAKDSLKTKSSLTEKTGYDIKKVNPADAKTLPIKENPVVKPEKINTATLPSKQAPVAKPSKQ